MRTNGLSAAAIVARPANGPHHPSRMNYAGTRPIEAVPQVTVFTTAGVPARPELLTGGLRCGEAKRHQNLPRGGSGDHAGGALAETRRPPRFTHYG
jgi:hypothetical protein